MYVCMYASFTIHEEEENNNDSDTGKFHHDLTLDLFHIVFIKSTTLFLFAFCSL